MIPTIENILKALFAGDMDVATASRYIATHIALAEQRGAALTPSPTPTAPQEADALREALRRISLIEIDRDADDADEMIERGISAVGQPRAGTLTAPAAAGRTA